MDQIKNALIQIAREFGIHTAHKKRDQLAMRFTEIDMAKEAAAVRCISIHLRTQFPNHECYVDFVTNAAMNEGEDATKWALDTQAHKKRNRAQQLLTLADRLNQCEDGKVPHSLTNKIAEKVTWLDTDDEYDLEQIVKFLRDEAEALRQDAEAIEAVQVVFAVDD